MPSERFLNLSAEKRQRILSAAEIEFSRVPYDEVSINQIIHIAGIPRGSFYQYFTGKQDLLEYMMQDFTGAMRRVVAQTLAETDGDIFAVIHQLFRHILALAVRYGKQDLFANIFSCLRQKDLRAFSFSRYDAKDLLKAYAPEIQPRGFRCQDEETLLDVLEMLVALLRQSLAQVFARTDDPEEVAAALDRKLKLLQYGVVPRGGEG